MKTLQEIEKLINDDRSEAERLNKTFASMSDEEQIKARKRIKKLRANIEYHEEVKLYLINSPSKEWLEKEEERLRRRIRLIHEGYEAWGNSNRIPFKKESEKLSYFNKINDVPTLKRHLKNTMFILN